MLGVLFVSEPPQMTTSSSIATFPSSSSSVSTTSYISSSMPTSSDTKLSSSISTRSITPVASTNPTPNPTLDNLLTSTPRSVTVGSTSQMMSQTTRDAGDQGTSRGATGSTRTGQDNSIFLVFWIIFPFIC